MNIKLSLLCIIWALSMQSQITVSDSIGCPPITINFGSVSTLSSYSWDFGNSASSSTASPSSTYTTPGTYIVKLNNTYTKTITILDSIKIGFTPNAYFKGCVPFTFNCNNTSIVPTGINVTSYIWSIDGQTYNGQNCTHTSTTNGYHDITFDILTSNPSCDRRLEKKNIFFTSNRPATKIATIPTTTSVCQPPFTVGFTNNSTSTLPLSYLWTWDFPLPGGTSSASSLPSSPITYTAMGTYKVTLKATDTIGCSKSDTINISINNLQLKLKFKDTTCYKNPFSDTIAITNLDTANYYYSFEYPNSMMYGDTLSSKGKIIVSGYSNITTTTTLSIKIHMISKANINCKLDSTIKVTVLKLNPDFNLIFNQCIYPLEKYITPLNITSNVNKIQWDYTVADAYGGKITTKQVLDSNPLHVQIDRFAKRDSFYRLSPLGIDVTLTYKDTIHGCEEFSKRSTTINSMTAWLQTNKTEGCAPLKVQFNPKAMSTSALSSVELYYGDGSSNTYSNTSATDHVYNLPGIYKSFAVVTNSQGCKDTTNFVYIKVADTLTPTFVLSKSSICPNEPITITNTTDSSKYDYTHFEIGDETPFSCPTGTSFLFSNIKSTGFVPITITTSKYGCKSTITSTGQLFVKGPKSTIKVIQRCEYKDSAIFIASNSFQVDQFVWNVGTGSSITTTDSILRIKYPLTNSNKKIILTSKNTSNSCQDFIDSTTIFIRDPTAVIAFGTTFCKKPSNIGNPFPYTLAQSSIDNDYLCYYNNTFFFTDLQGHTIQRPITFGSQYVKTDFVKDTFILGLIARDINGCTDTARQTVYLSSPKADFTYTGNYNPSKLCSKSDILTLTDHSRSPAGIKIWEWRAYWKDSVTPFSTSSVKNPSLNINFNKKYKGDTIIVVLKVTDSTVGCDGNTDSLVKKIPVVNPQDSILSIDSICFGMNVSLNSYLPLPNFNRTWWHHGVQLSGTNNTSLTITQTPRDTIRLIYTDPTVGCTDTVMKELFVSSKMRLGYINSNASKPYLCYPTDASSTIKVIDSNNTLLSCKWKINNNPNTTQSNPNTFPLDPGYNVTYLWVKNDYGCMDSIKFYDTVIKPDAVLSLDHKKICKGGTINLSATNLSFVDSVLWDFGNGILNTSNSKNLSYTYTQAPISDSTLISLIIFGPNGHCRKALSQPVYIYEAKANFERNHGLDTAFCNRPFPFRNTSTKGEQFRWVFGDGSSSNVKDSTIHPYTNAGTYDVTLYSTRDSLGCIDSVTKKVILYPYPKLFVKIDTVCFGDSSTIVANDTNSLTKLLLTPKINGKDTFTSPFKFIQNKDTTYKITAINQYGCLDSLFKIAAVIKPQHFVPNDTLDTIVAQGTKIVLPYQYIPSNSIIWIPSDDSFSCKNCSDPSYQVSSKRIFQVKVTDNKNCFTTNTFYFIEVYPDILIKIPDAFTPNGDGNNDILYAKGFGIKRLIYFRIFNRMGQMLFESHDETNGWDGHYKDQIQNSDAYFYTAEGEGYNGKTIFVEGAFMLLK